MDLTTQSVIIDRHVKGAPIERTDGPPVPSDVKGVSQLAATNAAVTDDLDDRIKSGAEKEPPGSSIDRPSRKKIG